MSRPIRADWVFGTEETGAKTEHLYIMVCVNLHFFQLFSLFPVLVLGKDHSLD